MKNFITILFISTGFLSSCNNAENTSATSEVADTATTKTDSAASDGWVSLFDGSTTAGWHSYGKDKAGERWKIADGALSIDTTIKSGGDLVTNAEYGNFNLKLEWKIAPKGNSGVIFYIRMKIPLNIKPPIIQDLKCRCWTMMATPTEK